MKKTTALLICMLSVMSISFTATAADQKLYPGSMCQSNSSDISYWRDWVTNPSDNDVWLTCPIVKDSLDSGHNIDYARVYVHDRNSGSGKDVKCTLWSSYVYATSTPGSYFEVRYSQGASNSVQTLYFNGDETRSGGNYTHSFECKIPEKSSTGDVSGVTAYYVKEKS